MKIKRDQEENLVRFTAEGTDDTEYLNALIEYIDRSNKRVSNAQRKMHEANFELVKMRRSWVYRVLKFIKGD